MKLGVFTVVLRSRKLPETLDYLAGLGVQAVELGAGGYAGTEHCPVDELLASPRQAKELVAAICEVTTWISPGMSGSPFVL